MWTHSKTAVSRVVPALCPVCETLSLQGCTCLWHKLIHSHHPLEVLVLQGLLLGPMERRPISATDLLQHGLTHSHNPFRNRPWPHPWLQALQGCSCSVLGLSMATFFEALQHNLVHSHWCYKVHLLQHASSPTTDASKCIFSCMDLSLGHNPFRGTPAPTQT